MKKLIALACMALFAAALMLPGAATAGCDKSSPKSKTATDEPATKTTQA